MSAGAKVRPASGVVIDVHAHRRDADSIAVIERDRAEVRAAALEESARLMEATGKHYAAADIRALAAQAPAQAKGGG